MAQNGEEGPKGWVSSVAGNPEICKVTDIM